MRSQTGVAVQDTYGRISDLPGTGSVPYHHSLSPRDQPLCVCVIKDSSALPVQSYVYHLNIMKESGLIEGVQQGNWIIYRLTDLGKKYADDTA